MAKNHDKSQISTIIIACGAIAKEVKILIKQLPQSNSVMLSCLPAILHNRPNLIPDRLDKAIQKFQALYPKAKILIAYADCGTGGKIASLCKKYSIPYIDSPHCYSFFASKSAFEKISNDDIHSFYLTDYLARHFERLVIQGLGIDKNPQLKDIIFKNYNRIVYLAQNPTPELEERAKQAAKTLNLSFIRINTGYGELQDFIHTQHE